MLPQASAQATPLWACGFLFNRFQGTHFGRGPCSAHKRSTKYSLGFPPDSWLLGGECGFRSLSPGPGLSPRGVLCFGQPLPCNRASQFVGTSNSAVHSHALWGGPFVLSLQTTDNLARDRGPRPLAQVPGSGVWLAAQAQSGILGHLHPILSSSWGLDRASP